MTRLPGPNDGQDDAPRPPTLGELLDSGRRPAARPAPAGHRLGRGIRARVAAGRRAQPGLGAALRAGRDRREPAGRGPTPGDAAGQPGSGSGGAGRVPVDRCRPTSPTSPRRRRSEPTRSYRWMSGPDWRRWPDRARPTCGYGSTPTPTPWRGLSAPTRSRWDTRSTSGPGATGPTPVTASRCWRTRPAT